MLGVIEKRLDQTPDGLLSQADQAYISQKLIDYMFYEEAAHRALDSAFLHIAEQVSGKRFVHVF